MVPIVKSLVGAGRNMGRSRYQQGTVTLVGKRIKCWRGRWHSYTVDAAGVEHRHNHTRTLGLKSEMTKDEAKKKLRDIIDREGSQAGRIRPSPDVTFEWFWKNNYLQMKKGEWSEATRSAVESVINRHVLPAFGSVELGDLSKLALQTHLYRVAANWSESVAKKVRVYVKAALEEAVDQDYIGKNPARKLAVGKTRKPNKRNHTPEELCKLFAGLVGEDHLILRIFVLAALRPGEQFALRWSDFKGDILSVQRAVRRVKKGENRVGDPKTEGSVGQVYLPASLQIELAHWKEIVRPSSDDEYIFRSRKGTPRDAHNYLRRHLKPLAAGLGVPNLTFQSLRRTFATLMQGKGTPKDAQTQLRHKDVLTTMNVYTQPIPESVKRSVEALDSQFSESFG
jgi:integrase